MALKILQLHKRASYEFKNIQDKYSYSLENDCYAIADGTTQSLYSEIWAQMLTTAFIENPVFKPQKLIPVFKGLAENFKHNDFKFSENPAKAALEREKLKNGATATFLAIKITGNNIEVISCGDSNLFILRDGKIYEAFPFNNIKTLDANGYFLNTEKLLQDTVDESFFQAKVIPIEPTDQIFLATDALSRFLLNNPDKFQELDKQNHFDSFHQFCLNYWEKKLLQEDDITLLSVSNFASKETLEISPPTDFSFPKEEEPEFIPTPLIPKTNPVKEIDMQTLNYILDELSRLRRKSDFQTKLLIIGLVLMVNILFISLLFIKQSKLSDEITTLKQEQIIIQNQLNEHLVKMHNIHLKDSITQHDSEGINEKNTADSNNSANMDSNTHK